jgi:Uma2 family endonuclease
MVPKEKPMTSESATLPPADIMYPSSDGKRMAENTQQARWITLLYSNLGNLYRTDPAVFVAADNLWYPVEGRPDICLAPDVYVVFNRPKGDRPSYLQWREGGIPLTVVFEILSPANDAIEMADKLAFYDEHGVEEYYIYDPDTNRLVIYRRGQATLVRQRPADGYQSPRMQIRFDLSGKELVVRYPDGRAFLTLEESEQRADKAEQRASAAEQRLARLSELSRKARRGEASPDELAELDRLENPTGA